MKTVKSIKSSSTIQINFIVYEKNDDGVLLICTVFDGHKSYQTNISVDFCDLDEVIMLINSSNQIDLYELISSELFNSKSLISEINLTSKLGKSIFITGERQAA